MDGAINTVQFLEATNIIEDKNLKVGDRLCCFTSDNFNDLDGAVLVVELVYDYQDT